MRGSSLPWWFHAMLCGLLMLPFFGCEDDDTNVPAVSDYQSVERGATQPPVETNAVSTVASLTISPTTVELAGDGDMASFTAAGGTSPYSWSVTDVFRGSVVDSGGSGAAYQRSAAGDNTVVVKDSKGKKAYAVVSQP
jgi:hypothetical protein